MLLAKVLGCQELFDSESQIDNKSSPFRNQRPTNGVPFGETKGGHTQIFVTYFCIRDQPIKYTSKRGFITYDEFKTSNEQIHWSQDF